MPDKVRLRAEGWFVIVLSVVLFYAAMNIQSGWLFTLDFSLIGLALSSWIVGFFSLFGTITASRSFLPCFEGEKTTVTLTLLNHGPLHKFLISVDDLYFIPWLEKKRILTATYPMETPKRGIYVYPKLQLTAATLGNFFIYRKKIACPGTLIVYPRAHPFNFSFSTEAASAAPHETGSTFRKRGGEEFLGIRDYEPGDSLRAIHWPSTAKLGILRARETQDVGLAPLTFFLDTDLRLKGESFETLVSATAYAVEESLRHGHPVRLVAKGEIKTVNRWEALEILAATEATSRFDLSSQLEKFLDPLKRESLIFILTTLPQTFIPDNWVPLQTLRQASVSCHLIALRSKTERQPDWLLRLGIPYTLLEP